MGKHNLDFFMQIHGILPAHFGSSSGLGDHCLHQTLSFGKPQAKVLRGPSVLLLLRTMARRSEI